MLTLGIGIGIQLGIVHLGLRSVLNNQENQQLERLAIPDKEKKYFGKYGIMLSHKPLHF